MAQFRVGILGCGNISSIYLKNLQAFAQTEVVAVTDLDLDRAKAKAEEFSVPHVLPVDEFLAMEGMDLVVNLTVPAVHTQTATQVLQHGKHVYNEKPLTLSREEAKALLDLAKSKGLTVGCAPDTVLGAGIQTARELLDAGKIGTPLHAQAWMMGGGVEKWHPNPDFFYKPGAGPLFDMGPYYLSALITLFGPASSVTAMHNIGIKQRTIESEPFKGQTIDVETPTHYSLVARFESGPIAQFTASFETFAGADYPCIDVFGTEGVMRIPDPNTFGGPLKVRKGWDEWEEITLTRPYHENTRGLGVLDQLLAHAGGRPARASGAMAGHLVDIMQSAYDSGNAGTHVPITVKTERPAAMPTHELID